MGVRCVKMAACEHPPVGVQRDHGFWSSDGGNCSESERKSPSSGSVSPVGLAHFCDEDSQVQTASTDWAQLEKGKVNLLAVSSHEEPPNEPHFENQSLKSESERSKSAERSRRGFHTQIMAARATPSTDIAIVSQLEPAPQLLAVLETVLSELSSSNEEKPAQLQVNTLQGELATFKESASRQDDLDAQGKTAQLEPIPTHQVGGAAVQLRLGQPGKRSRLTTSNNILLRSVGDISKHKGTLLSSHRSVGERRRKQAGGFNQVGQSLLKMDARLVRSASMQHHPGC